MKECVLCGKEKASEALRVCVDCIRTGRGNTIFLYACNFDCLFCQNASHNDLGAAETLNINDFVSSVKTNEDAYCVCKKAKQENQETRFSIDAIESFFSGANEIRNHILKD